MRQNSLWKIKLLESRSIVRKENIPPNLSNLAFDFFYWFSRFEFALKENKYLRNHTVGANAEPGWDKFVLNFQNSYVLSDQASALLQEKPERQVVTAHHQLAWEEVDLSECKSQLERVVRVLKTVRNNLFHGGKSGCKGWDNPERTELLLSLGKAVLDQFASLAQFQHDYTEYY